MTTLDHDSRSNLEEQFSDAEYDAIYDEIFGQFDSNYTLYESGERSDPASFSVAYDEKLGACYIAFDERKLNSDHEAATDMASPARRVLFGINLRNGELFHNLYDPKLNDMADKNVVIPVLRKILESVPEEKMPNLSKLLDQPSGFPEMEHVLQQLTDTPPISVSSITDGSTVIIRELNEYMVIKVKHVEQVRSTNGAFMARYFVENEDDIMKVSDTDRLVTKGGVTHWDSGEKVAYVHFSYSRDIKIWQLDSDQFKAFSKYQLKDVDPSMDYTLTREGYITAMSLNGMAYERWGADQEKIITANPKRYERVTSLHYSAALDALVERYGIEEFMNSAKWVIRSHLYGLHFPTHIANAWGDTHTDISGFREPTSALASAAVRKKHPVVADFGESGRVGLGVYNAKPLFADLDFWNYMTVDHPDSAYELIQYFFSLGEISQGQHYDNYSFIPKEMLVVSFPEVTKLLESFLGTFSSTKLEH